MGTNIPLRYHERLYLIKNNHWSYYAPEDLLAVDTPQQLRASDNINIFCKYMDSFVKYAVCNLPVCFMIFISSTGLKIKHTDTGTVTSTRVFMI